MSARQGIHTDDLAPAPDAAIALFRAMRSVESGARLVSTAGAAEVINAVEAAGFVVIPRDALSACVESFDAIQNNDHTPRYRYENVEDADAVLENRFGKKPPMGRRWFAPREIAAIAKVEIGSVLGQ